MKTSNTISTGPMTKGATEYALRQGAKLVAFGEAARVSRQHRAFVRAASAQGKGGSR